MGARDAKLLRNSLSHMTSMKPSPGRGTAFAGKRREIRAEPAVTAVYLSRCPMIGRPTPRDIVPPYDQEQRLSFDRESQRRSWL